MKENEKAEKFLDVYPNFNIELLPSYIRKEIDQVFVVGKQKKTLLLPNGRHYLLNNKLNDLTGAEWTFFTNSVINTNYSTKVNDDAYSIRKIHPSPKPPALLKSIIEFFTKEGQLVFDYFAGVGGTLLASSMSERKCIGIELNRIFGDAYKKANDYLKLKEQTMIIGDALAIMNGNSLDKLFSEEMASLILIDPPYSNMMSKAKTGGDIKKYGKEGTPFTSSKNDLGNMEPDDFWKSFLCIVDKSLRYLKDRGHLVVFIKDLQPSGKSTNLLHAQMIEKLNSIQCLYYRGMKIWADQTAKLYPYGYPFGFVATQIHQYILVFQKRSIIK